MSVEHRVDQESGVIAATFTGPMPLEEVIGQIESVLKSLDGQSCMGVLSDVRGLEHQASSEDVKRVSDLIAAYTDTVRGMKLALVVSEPVMYGMMRMLQARLDTVPLDVGVFYDMDDAKRWLEMQS